MADEAATQGTDAGELETAAAGSADEATLQVDDPLADTTFLERLRKVDPSKLPNDVRINLEKSVLPDATRQRQELAEERRRVESEKSRLLDLVGQALNQRGLQPTQEQRDEIREKVINGDLEAIPQLVERMVNDRVMPGMHQLTVRSIFDEAQRANPILAEPEVAQMVNETFASQPILKEMARLGNFEGTKLILQSLAERVKLQRAETELKALKDPARDKKIADDAVAAYRAKVNGLPATTSRGGSSTHAEPTTKTLGMREAMDAAYGEIFGS